MHVGNDDEDKDTCEDKELEFMPQMVQTKDKSSQGFTTDLECWHFSQYVSGLKYPYTMNPETELMK
jgi:hypothetical protein